MKPSNLPDRLAILMVEDSEDDAELILRELRRWFDVEALRVASGEQLQAALAGRVWDAVVCDFSLPGFSAMAAFRLVNQAQPDLPFIVVSGTISESEAVALMDAGIRDFVSKQHLARLVPALRRELRDAQIRREHNRALDDLARANQRLLSEIDERQRTEHRLAEQTAELQHSNAELEQFAYVASHDLREPLRMITSYVELLAERYRGRLDERADKYISYAVDGAKRMSQLIDDLLALSRVGSQGRPLEPTDAGAVARRVIAELRPTIEASGAEIVRDELPMVLADETQLAQLLRNLLGNALKFRAEGRAPRIRLGAAGTEAGMQLLAVEDNGIGIEEQHKERIFQMFQRLHGRGSYEGSGIGLAIARKIVERHGGRIWLTSTAGQGTTFYVSLPAVDSETSDPGVLPLAPPEPASPISSAEPGKRAAVADDRPCQSNGLEPGRDGPQAWRMRNPFRCLKSSPEVIRLTVMMYIRYPLSLRRMEGLVS